MSFLASRISCLVKISCEKMSSLLNKSTFKADWETRSENLQTDMLQLLERGDFYDCTFQVSSKPGGQDKKEFKCHKVLLSTASCVFSKMLFGHFKEAFLGVDEPIVLEGVSPEAFECAMRFLYGQERKFASLEIAMEVYKLAHEMQITSLLHAVEQELLKDMDEIKALQLFNLFVQLENQEGLEICKQLIARHTAQVLSSETWVSVPASVVQEVLQMEQLDASEPQVAAALLRWGRAQLDDPAAELRPKVDFGLKLIRFCQLDAKQFAELCQGDLGVALSGEEKFQILDCIVQDKWDGMPAQLGPMQPSLRTRLSFSLELKMQIADLVSGSRLSEFNQMTVSVDKQVCFVGLRFVQSELSAAACANLRPTCMQVFRCRTRGHRPDVLLGKCNDPQGDVFTLGHDCVFNAGLSYKIQFEFPNAVRGGQRKLHAIYTMDQDYCQPYFVWAADGQMINLHAAFATCVAVNVAELMFKRLE